jgi:hypothetical protein
MMLFGYDIPLGLMLIAIGVAFVCVGLIQRRRTRTQPSEPEDPGELRAFVDSLQRTDDEASDQPRIDRIRNQSSS